jgi:hypothetical protein
MAKTINKKINKTGRMNLNLLFTPFVFLIFTTVLISFITTLELTKAIRCEAISFIKLFFKSKKELI